MLELRQQITQLISRSKNILICFRKNWTIDGVASALALANWLEKLDKQVIITVDGFEVSKELKFLKNIDRIKNEIKNLRKFVISLDLEGVGVEEFSYDTDDKELKIFITPRSGFFRADNIKTSTTDFRFDLIIIVDTSDLESLSTLYEDNREFFYNTPIINFDHTSHNEHYGQINLVDLKCVSVSEVIYNFLKSQESDVVDAGLATYLLTGMFDKTNSFKTTNLTPASLEIASELIKIGADRELIVKNLYQSKTLAVLKLWGRILARLNQDKSIKLVWSLLSHDDFVKTGANESDVCGVVDELIKSVPEAEIILVLYEVAASKGEPQELKICGQLFTSQNYDSIELVRTFRPEGTKEFAKFCLENVRLLEAEKVVIDEIRKNLTT